MIIAYIAASILGGLIGLSLSDGWGWMVIGMWSGSTGASLGVALWRAALIDVASAPFHFARQSSNASEPRRYGDAA